MFNLLTQMIKKLILPRKRSKFLVRKKIVTLCKITKRWSFSQMKPQKRTQNINTSKLLKSKLLCRSVAGELNVRMEWASAVHNSRPQTPTIKTIRMSPKIFNLTQKSAFWMIVQVWEVLGRNLTWQHQFVLSDQTNVFLTKLANRIL